MIPYEGYTKVLKFLDNETHDKIIDGILNYDDNIVINHQIDFESIKIIDYLVMDNPQLFHFEGIKTLVYPDRTAIYPKYSMEKNEYWRIRENCINRSNGLIANFKSKNTYDAIKKVHDYFCSNYSYKNLGELSHTIVDPLLNNKGVCDGFSKLFKLFMDMLGIPSIIISGKSSDNSDPNIANYGPHAWNMVCIDGSWVHIDVTFDLSLSLSNTIRYDYFCLTDDEIKKDHIYHQSIFNSTNSGYNYYLRNDLIMYTKNQYRLFLRKLLKTPISEIVIKIPQTKNLDKLIDNFMLITHEELSHSSSKFNGYSVSQNINQFIFQISLDMSGSGTKDHLHIRRNKFLNF